MVDDSKSRLEKAAKLVTLLREHEAKVFELTEEIAKVLGGQAAIGDTLKRLQHYFDGVWCHRYAPGQTSGYVWQWAKDTVLMKKLLKSLAVDEIERRMASYLKSADPFFVKNRHTFGLFVSSVNQFAQFNADVVEESPAPADCKHSPRCQSDQEHTRKRSADMRSSLGPF